jgi:hypothetical protein
VAKGQDFKRNAVEEEGGSEADVLTPGQFGKPDHRTISSPRPARNSLSRENCKDRLREGVFLPETDSMTENIGSYGDVL